MPQYFSPGVYVEEVPSAEKPIAGVSTSTAGFIGVIPDVIDQPLSALTGYSLGKGRPGKKDFDLPVYPVNLTSTKIKVKGKEKNDVTLKNDDKRVSTAVFATAPAKGEKITADIVPDLDPLTGVEIGTGTGNKMDFHLPVYPVNLTSTKIKVKGKERSDVQLKNDDKRVSTATFDVAPAKGEKITADIVLADPLTGVEIGTGTGDKVDFDLPIYPVNTSRTTVKVNGTVPRNVTLTNVASRRVSTATFTTAPAADDEITADIMPIFSPVAPGVPKLCTNFSEFTNFFGDFSGNPQHGYLAHAVYGFFKNGGSRCYVMRVTEESHIPRFLINFEAIDEIAIVAAPGLAQHDTPEGPNTRTELIAHCQTQTQNRFAIFDSPAEVEKNNQVDLPQLAKGGNVLPPSTDFAAFYFPWIEIFDPVKKAPVFTPPSGHVAGIYARVDAARGVHKAPANEPVLGAVGLKYRISKAQQDGLNPQGVNCIRNLNGNLTVWGARTLGEADLKYINVRRTLLFLRKSIDEATQWVVFEPNEPGLWQKITRNVTAFLTTVWRSGALFGTTQQEAFYVKCDAETNPPALREMGQVVTEVGVAIVRPAEFVIFRISQFTASGK